MIKALDPNSRISVSGEGTAGVQEQMGSVFQEGVRGASDAPKEKQAKDLGKVLYIVHLAILLYWFHGHSKGARHTRTGTPRDPAVL